MSGFAIAVDGGNSKTHLALLDSDGEMLALVRGLGCSPHHIGLSGCVERLSGLLDEARGVARIGAADVAGVAYVMVAGADLPDEEIALQAALDAQGWAHHLVVSNDTFALLRSGSARDWGVAVVCGAGINCVGRAPDGREARFAALGAISGDWGGGYDLGLSAVSAAARSEDGRGPTTILEKLVPLQFGLGTPREVSEAIHREQIGHDELVQLAPIVLGAADSDLVAGSLVDRTREEVVALARVALERLDLLTSDPDVVLGGGVLTAGLSRLVDGIRADIMALCPGANIVLVSSPPVVGAAMLALADLGADTAALERARQELTAAVTNGT
jgi:N-acetylglucosamine kinase-like BadF-type ATPase